MHFINVTTLSHIINGETSIFCSTAHKKCACMYTYKQAYTPPNRQITHVHSQPHRYAKVEPSYMCYNK